MNDPTPNPVIPVSERLVIQDQNEMDIPTEDLEKENNTHLVLDPVLMDITNQTITQHEVLRNMARQDLQNYTDKMANQMNKGKKSFTNFMLIIALFFQFSVIFITVSNYNNI